MKKTILFVLFIQLVGINASYATIDDCYAKLVSDTLSIGNNLIQRTFLWNNGNLITLNIIDKVNNQDWVNQNKIPDFFIPQSDNTSQKGSWKSEIVESPISPQYREVIVEYMVDQLQVKRVYRVYPDCPAIAVDTYLKGSATGSWIVENTNSIVSRNVLSQQNNIPVIDQISLDGKHWSVNAIEFLDASDNYNTLVQPYQGLSYNENTYRGNLLFFQNKEIDKGLFILKEAPCSNNQLAYPGADYITNFGSLKQIGLGIVSSDLQTDEWIKTYSSVTGVYAGDEIQQLTALRKYQKNVRSLQPDRDDMIVMNTWGDRGEISRITESFCLEQMKACANLGISHFQIDWGWQQGRSENRTNGRDVWKPNEKIFPEGFSSLVKKGKELGVELCLYLVPSLKYDNEAWEEDADALINLYKNYGIRIFKIDGQKIPSKIAEIRTQKMYDKVLKETNNEVVFNLDITAGPRGGYFFFNQYGNLFVENRYTDWGNYYPYWTLRNLWMLSKYVPAERLQVEFLNKWRNQNNYGNDPFAPCTYSLDYLFAITMAAQPLAFFDAGALPQKAFDQEGLIKRYRTIQHDFHNGIILPIGDEPSGKSWTGFQSMKKGEGYLLIFRELNSESSVQLKTYLESGASVELTPLFGDGKKSKQRVLKSGIISVSLPKKNSYVMYKYKTNK